MPVDERGVAVGITLSDPAGTEVSAPGDCCVGAAGAAIKGVAVGANGSGFSVSRATGVKVSVGLSDGVTEPSSGADLVALPPGSAITTVSSGVAASPACVGDCGVGVGVSSPASIPCCVDGAGVALTVAVSVGAIDTAVVDVKVAEVMILGASIRRWLRVCVSLPSH